MNDLALHQLKKTWDQELKVLLKLTRKLRSQLRAQKEFRILEEMLRLCKKVQKTLGDILTEQNRETRLGIMKTFFKLCSKASEASLKFGEYAHQYIQRKFLLEFSTISYACASRFYYLLREILPFLNRIFKREKALLTSEQKRQESENNAIVIH